MLLCYSNLLKRTSTAEKVDICKGFAILFLLNHPRAGKMTFSMQKYVHLGETGFRNKREGEILDHCSKTSQHMCTRKSVFLRMLFLHALIDVLKGISKPGNLLKKLLILDIFYRKPRRIGIWKAEQLEHMK